MKKFIPFEYEIKDIDEKGVVTFYANAFNVVDSDNDISLPGSFRKTIGENRSRLRHLKWHDPRFMPGAIKEISEDEIGLLSKSQLILNTQLGRETYEEYKALASVGQRMEHSVAVHPVKYSFNSNQVREVSEWKLTEVSTLTAWGANSSALTVEIKSLENYTREQLEQDIVMLKALMNIRVYDDIKLEQIEKQINYLNELKAVIQPEPPATTDIDTLEEFKALLNLNK